MYIHLCTFWLLITLWNMLICMHHSFKVSGNKTHHHADIAKTCPKWCPKTKNLIFSRKRNVVCKIFLVMSASRWSWAIRPPGLFNPKFLVVVYCFVNDAANILVSSTLFSFSGKNSIFCFWDIIGTCLCYVRMMIRLVTTHLEAMMHAD